MAKVFSKNDNEFICINCKQKVDKLNYTSRDHCNNCLCSLHVDINPGDRANVCCGLLKPIDIDVSGKKGYVIVYKCERCGKIHRNKAASDDNIETIFSVMNGTYKF